VGLRLLEAAGKRECGFRSELPRSARWDCDSAMARRLSGALPPRRNCPDQQGGIATQQCSSF